jgi:hypothetical protein
VNGSDVASRWQAGYVEGDSTVHGVRPTISGYRAWCGAGAIDVLETRRFDPAERGVCPTCVRLLQVPVPRPRPASA